MFHPCVASISKFFLAGALLAGPLLAGSATAADMPAKTPSEPAAPARNWTGCYFGINAGGAAAGSDVTTVLNPGTYLFNPTDVAAVSATGSGSGNISGFIGGGQAGCNLQIDKVVFGIEGDYDYFSATSSFITTGTLVSGDTFIIDNSVKTNWLATVRPRLGLSAADTFIYVTGGVAFAKLNYRQLYSDTALAAGGALASRNATGWTAGVGFETALKYNFSVKLEYLFAKFPSVGAVGGILDTFGNTNVLQSSADLAIQTVRVGLNYKL